MSFSRIFVGALNRQMRPEQRRALQAFNGRVAVLRAGPVRVALRVDHNGEFSPVHSAVCADADIEVANQFIPRPPGEKNKTQGAGDPEFLRVVDETLRAAAMNLETNPAAAPAVLAGRAAVRIVEAVAPRAGDALVKNKTLADPQAVQQFNRQVENLTRAVDRMESAVADAAKQQNNARDKS